MGAGANRWYFKALEIWKLPRKNTQKRPWAFLMEEEPAKETEQG